MAMTPDEAMEFFDGNGLHITDGCDSCSGHDREAMQAAAEELAARNARAVSAAVAEELEAFAVLTETFIKSGRGRIQVKIAAALRARAQEVRRGRQ